MYVCVCVCLRVCAIRKFMSIEKCFGRLEQRLKEKRGLLKS